MMRSMVLPIAMVVTLWIAQPLLAQAVPTSGSGLGLGPRLDSRLVELTKGRQVRFAYGAPRALEGELLAVDDQSMWLLSNGQTRNIPLDGLGEIQVRQHGFGATKVWTWIGIGAAVTGIGMAAACSTVEDATGCGGWFFGMGLGWGVIGGLFSLDVVGSSWAEVPPVREGLLRYARFPQGLPEGYGR